MEIIATKEWFALLDVLKEEKGIVILLGATDTGKSSLIKFLILNLCQQGLKVALVDADIGQSFLGPPTTIGLAVFKSDPAWEVVLSPPTIFFVGAPTPAGHFSLYLKDSVSQEFAIEEIQIEGEVIDPAGECIPLDWSLRIHGLLIGLKNSNDETLALGIIKNYFEEKNVVRVSTPLRDTQRVRTIQLSSLKVIPLYEEERV